MPSKFKPTRDRKRKVLARKSDPASQTSSLPDSNAEIINTSKSEREERRQKLWAGLRSAQPKISAKKQKRLDKFIEKKLKKDEAADLVKKLEKEKDKYDARGLQSSKTLKRKFEHFVSGQLELPLNHHEHVDEQSQSLQNGHMQEAETDNDESDDVLSVDSFEESHQNAFDPDNVPEDAFHSDETWLKQRAPPAMGTGLAQPLQLGANGLPVIPMRDWKRRKPDQSIESVELEQRERAKAGDDGSETHEELWQGFSDREEDISDDDKESSSSKESRDGIDPRLKNIDENVLDALLAELERSDESEEEGSIASHSGDEASAHTSDPDPSVSEGEEVSEQNSTDGSDSDASTDTSSSSSSQNHQIKPRASAFKSWATQQLNQSIGHVPFYDQPRNEMEPTTEPKSWDRPAAGYRLGIQEGERPKDDRRAYTVHVQRSDSIQATRLQLPILQREQEIMEAVHNNPVVVVKGDTGSGKTTQLPQFLFEAGFGDKIGPTPGMIGVTQPRRVAAVSMAKRVAEELGDHGHKVAHQIRFDTTVSSKTAMKFMTDGILLRELSQDLLLKKYSVIVIDEAHERSVNTDLLIGMLSKIVPARMKRTEQNPDPRPLKVIIMSATLNINDFLHDKLFSAGIKPPVVEAEGRQHRVTAHFALRSRADYIEEIIEKIKRGHRKLPRGGMLVFLTGQNEIKYVQSRLRKEMINSARQLKDDPLPRLHISAAETPLEMDDLDIGSINYRDKVVDSGDDIDIVTNEAELEKEFEISDDEDGDTTNSLLAKSPDKILLNRDPYDTVHLLPLYSQLPTTEQLRIFEPPPDRARLIVLSTNVAETSLTIPGIRYVFDCGRSKERKFNTETGVQSFEIDYISKASAQQRAGRAGRTGPGHCWRLYSSAMYEQFFPEHAEPEILRTPAESVILQLKGFRYPRPVAEFPFPSAPNPQMLLRAERLLTDLGAITGSGGMLTDVGRKLSLYPLLPRLSKILVNATAQAKFLNELLALVAALSVEEVFIHNSHVHETRKENQADQTFVQDENQEEQKQQYGRAQAAFGKHDKSCDALKLLTASQMYLNATDKDSFCRQYFLRSKAMSEIAQLFSQLRSMVQINNPELSQTLKHVQFKEKLKTDAIKSITATVASGFIDQIALRYDVHPTPPVVARRPTRAIDMPYLPLTPLHHLSSPDSTISDKAVFIHPSSLLSRVSTRSLPEYIVYRHLQTSQPQTISSATSTDSTTKPKTRMMPLCTLDAQTLLSLIRDTGLIEYGKPIPKTKVEDVPGSRPKERVCWVGTEAKRTSTGNGALGWPLPPSKVRQVMDLKAPTGWRVVEVLA